MRVCHVTFSFTIGGIENLVIDILNEQSKSAEVSLVVVNDAYSDDLLSRISSRVDIVLIKRPPGNKLNVFYIVKLWFSLIRINPTIIHCHTHNLIKILFPFRDRCIYTAHELGVPTGNLNRYRKLYAISKAVRADLLSRGSFQSQVVYNGIDGERMVKRESYHTGDLFKIVQISRLQHEKKGQDILIEAAKILIYERGIRNIRVFIIGDGPSEDYLRNITAKYRLTDYVVFLGPKDRSWIYSNLFSFDLLVQPSRFEGFGLTLLESLFAGVPVVASSVGGPAEILDGVPGALLFKSEDTTDLADKIQAVLRHYSNGEVKTLTELSLSYISSKYSVTATANNYLEQYCSVN